MKWLERICVLTAVVAGLASGMAAYANDWLAMALLLTDASLCGVNAYIFRIIQMRRTIP